MTRLRLDTSAYSDFQRGYPAVVDHIDRAGWIGLPSVVPGELRAGFLLGVHTDRNARALREFKETHDRDVTNPMPRLSQETSTLIRAHFQAFAECRTQVWARCRSETAWDQGHIWLRASNEPRALFVSS